MGQRICDHDQTKVRKPKPGQMFHFPSRKLTPEEEAEQKVARILDFRQDAKDRAATRPRPRLPKKKG